MIITHLHITNYKQFGGSHDIEFPQLATVGVIGPNGVGKTTLFEAIEWALYSPTNIKAQEVRPRTYTGKTEVRVTLEDEATNTRYIVERELPRGSAKARIYRSDSRGNEEKIVEGASEVTTYVANQLIGLEHAAFVATFFTRQKELGFFAGSPTNRRRNVGKLLGLETIRTAQQFIAEDRKQAQAEARIYQAQYEAQQKNRDFPQEVDVAEKRIADAQANVAGAMKTVEALAERVAGDEKELAAVEKLRDEDASLLQAILQKQNEHDLALQQAGNATRELERLTAAATERTQFEPLAAKLPSLTAEDEAQSATRKSALRKRDLEQAIVALDQRAADAQEAASAAINQAPSPDGAPAWSAMDLATAMQWAGGIQLDSLEQKVATTQQAVDLSARFIKEQETLTRYNQRAQLLQDQLDTLRAEGDPTERIQVLDERMQQLQASSSAADTTRKRLHNDLQRSERILGNLRSQNVGETCPTCQRPFTAEDSQHVIGVFEREVQEIQHQLRLIQEQIQSNNGELGVLKEQRAKLIELSKQVTDTLASIESGHNHVNEKAREVEALSHELQSRLAQLGRDTVPSTDEATQVASELTAWRRVVDAAQTLRRVQTGLDNIRAEREPIATELVSLQDVQYDEAFHRDVALKRQEAQRAADSISRIDAELARRPEIEQLRDTSNQIAEAAQKDLTALQADRTKLGFEPKLLESAQGALRASREEERVAIEARHRAQNEQSDAQHALRQIENERDRITKLAVVAEARQRDADDLDQIYREFTEFERYASAWYSPRLSEITSELVDQVTDGKYNRVEFDDDFSIRVYDGEDEHFPYEQFSGGERDAIALCARIGLSRLIGGASATPPGFLVLDEVFGSLDLERRTRLLEMLGAITGAGDHFRQIFLISHVDDVRTSPILDEVWHVFEESNGRSEVEPLAVGADIGEM